MKNHFLSRFESYRIRNTIILLIIAILSIIISLLVGVNDNIPMILLLLGGTILFFIAILNLWQNATYYAILIVAFAVIFTINLFVGRSEDIVMGIGFICVAGFIAGIIGLFIRAKSWNPLPFIGASLSLLALAILVVTMPPPSVFKNVTRVTVWILVGLQLFIAILLVVNGYLKQRESRLSRISLTVSAIMLIIMSLWGFILPTMESESIGNWKYSTGIFAIVELIIAFIVIYTIIKAPKPGKV
jgi:hypothetical protein